MRWFAPALVAWTALGAGCRAVGPHDAAPPAALGASGSASTDPRIASLHAADFAVRARAGEALVAEGEAALGALGAAADGERRGADGPSRTQPVIAAILGAVPADRLVAVHLRSPSPSVRATAATEVGRRGDWARVPALIDAMTDGDPRVRASSIAALRRVTGRLYDLDLRAPPAVVASVAERERAWWRAEGRLAAPARPVGG